MGAPLLAPEDRCPGRRSCGLHGAAVIVSASHAAGGGGGLKEPICLKALCEQSTLYFTFLFTLLIFGQSKEE